MKSIEINKEQKEKLLEMCKILFPEYKNQSFYTDQDDSGRDFIKDFVYVGNSTKGIGIHWFEFCLTHLADKIFFNYNLGTNIADYINNKPLVKSY